MCYMPTCPHMHPLAPAVSALRASAVPMQKRNETKTWKNLGSWCILTLEITETSLVGGKKRAGVIYAYTRRPFRLVECQVNAFCRYLKKNTMSCSCATSRTLAPIRA